MALFGSTLLANAVILGAIKSSPAPTAGAAISNPAPAALKTPPTTLGAA